jgi:prepilin-type N-terminal cleavage/methylation domain-containing protein
LKIFKSFTLIELLIVVLIIAILAAIAVPNFLEAQIRAKTSRAKADFRTIATALEAYHVDNLDYPYGVWVPGVLGPGSLENYIPLTTPIAYITIAPTEEPFRAQQGYFEPDGTWVAKDFGHKHYFYWLLDGPFVQFFNHHPIRGAWLLRSVGPDSRSEGALVDAVTNSGKTEIFETADGYPGVNVIYDPTNGTISRGDITRGGGQFPSAAYREINQ